MQTYIMLGKYSLESFKGMSKQRTDKAIKTVEKYGGKIISIYVLLGGYDIVIISNFPNTQQAMKSSISITKFSGISFSTFPAVTVEEFDKLIKELN